MVSVTAHYNFWLLLIPAFPFCGLALGVAMRQRDKRGDAARAEAGVTRMRNSIVELAMGLSVLTIWGALVVSSLAEAGGALRWTSVTSFGFMLLSLCMIVNNLVTVREVSPEGMRYRRITGQSGSFRWAELKAVRYRIGKRFLLELDRGEKVRVSATVEGLPEFARLVLAHAPAQAIDEWNRSVLRTAASGNIMRVLT